MSTTPPRTRVRPRHFTRPDWRKARFLIDCPAMSDAGLWTFEADGVWHIIHGTPGAGLVPFRCDGTVVAMLDEVAFIADCVSFDHDMAVASAVVKQGQHSVAAVWKGPPDEPVEFSVTFHRFRTPDQLRVDHPELLRVVMKHARARGFHLDSAIPDQLS